MTSEHFHTYDLFILRSRVKSNDDWLRHSENLYREEQKRIGAYARQCREASGVSLRELARRMKISAPFLSDLEKGNRHWTDGTLTAWEDAHRTMRATENSPIANDAAGAHSLRHLVSPPLEPADCVCCGEPKQTGRYAGLPCCFKCYETGLLREWLEQHKALNWPNDKIHLR